MEINLSKVMCVVCAVLLNATGRCKVNAGSDEYYIEHIIYHIIYQARDIEVCVELLLYCMKIQANRFCYCITLYCVLQFNISMI